MAGLKIKLLPIDEASNSLDPKHQLQAIENALNETALAIKVDYSVTVQTWKRKPTFKIEKPDQYTRDIYTENEIYGYVSEGTDPHPIRARNKPMLVFQANYAAKTTPRVIASKQGGPYGPWRTAYEVQHPGFPGREFPEVINDKWEKQWPTQLQRAINSVTM